MNTDWKRIKQVLAEAARRESPAERAAYLNSTCHSDKSLRAEVEKLLHAYDRAGAFLETPALPLADMAGGLSAPPREQAGDKIGPYRLLEPIGEGGCGVVYLAEQEQPIRRRVAIKVIKLGMDTKAVIARFEVERQALALMDHPYIARVLDAGATDTGRPYFVMELVQGDKMTDYCDRHHLSTEARLHLFVSVCHALQHAHHKGIIHRDIKPSNILVTLHDGVAVPKVIDFGIAKATDQRLTEQNLATGFGQCIGTPAYMSPEQAEWGTLDIDTRSDIYALGVLLYELLTGQTPFAQPGRMAVGLDEMRRIIREQEPARPSTRLRTLALADQVIIAGCRRAEPRQLLRRLRGDLDWIVMRCLEKDRARRYETANSLAEDITRHLNHEPVRARPPSRRYQFHRLVQRNQAVFAAAGLVTVVLMAGLGFSIWTLAKERVARFLKDMLQRLGPSPAAGRDATMLLEILNQTAERVGVDLIGQPEVNAELRMTLGAVYQALGRYEPAEAMFREALRQYRIRWDKQHTNVADALDALGHELASCRGEVAESGALITQALAIRTNLLGPEHAQVAASLQHLGEVHMSQAKLIEAEELFQRALAMRLRLFGNEHLEVAETLATMAQTRTWQARQEEAEAFAREALAILSRVVPDQRALLAAASARTVLGEIRRRQGQVEEALDLQRKAMTSRKNLLGSAHPDYADTLHKLACALLSANQLGEAETTIREAVAIHRSVVSDRYSSIHCLETLARILRQAGRFAEAEQAYREAHPTGLCPGLISVLRAQGKLIEAEIRMSSVTSEARQAFEAARTLPPSEFGVSTRRGLATALWYQGQMAESESLLEEAMQIGNHLALSPTLIDQLSFQAMRNAALEVWWERQAEHAALCQSWLARAENQSQFTFKGRAAAMVNLRPATDSELQIRAFNLAQQAVQNAPANALLVWYRLTLGVAAYRLERYSEAQRIFLESEQDGPTAWHPAARTNTSKFFRAMMLFRQGQPDAARRLFTEAEATTPPLPAEVKWSLAEGADYDDLMLWLACREARALLNSP